MGAISEGAQPDATTGAIAASTSPTAASPAAAESPSATALPDAIEVAAPEDVSSDEFEPQDIDDNASGASTSVTSSIYEHNFEHGRRYHSYKNSRYPIPNDDMEQSREDMKHAMMLELTDGIHFFAPIGDSPQKIIDLGTGTGIWAIEVADQFPSAEVLGIDITPIQPLWVPPNLRFIVDDIQDDWLNGEGFDFVHARQMFPLLTRPNKVLAESFAHLKPGGWFECQELSAIALCDDGTVPADYSLGKFLNLAAQALRKFGSDMQIATKLEEPIKAAGFVNITAKKFKVPVGTWPKDKRLRLVGLYFRHTLEQMLGVFGAKPFAALGMSQVEIEVFLAGVRQDLKNNDYHSYMEYIFWTAQKPG
ncbi:S-adenosyl-L-methionine-dependent methyltransferase [Lasiosphaeria ovina]|uniref:S-adenosyl-L-methionine-dependent methyltransferase n=1 Tax=Lasiosphaeria ovina TaxID=92902 RepID=A0AAE0KJ25_9PEZI|nr:S-adenosyl-L-methionine-dependent methyltransferase [Lasiosphaeria ovina]